MADKIIKISDLKVKEQVEDLFLIKSLILVEGRDGRPYLNITLSDSSGELEARMWQNVVEVNKNYKTGEICKIKGKVNLYQNRKQFVIQEISKIENTNIELNDFYPASRSNAEEMYEELFNIVKSLKDVYIKDLLTLVLEDKEIKRRLQVWPAGKTIHHAYRSGLLEHILSCATLSLFLSKHYKLNTSYVVAGAILHDLCKIYELSDGPAVEYTEEGKLVGHLAKSTEIIDRFSSKIKNFPFQMKLHLKHIMLSHHGSYEYGSPKLPQTKEAYLVHLIDFTDSKINSMDQVIATDPNQGHWSNYVKHLDRVVFKKELPTFKDYIQPPKRNNQEIKQNMGELLKDFKVE